MQLWIQCLRGSAQGTAGGSLWLHCQNSSCDKYYVSLNSNYYSIEYLISKVAGNEKLTKGIIKNIVAMLRLHSIKHPMHPFYILSNHELIQRIPLMNKKIYPVLEMFQTNPKLGKLFQKCAILEMGNFCPLLKTLLELVSSRRRWCLQQRPTTLILIGGLYLFCLSFCCSTQKRGFSERAATSKH